MNISDVPITILVHDEQSVLWNETSVWMMPSAGTPPRLPSMWCRLPPMTTAAAADLDAEMIRSVQPWEAAGMQLWS